MKYIYIIIFFLIGKIYSQEDSLVKEDIKLITKTNGNKVLLRWAVSNPYAWIQTNERGFFIERYTMYKDGKILMNKDMKKIMLTKLALKPAPKEIWEPLLKENNINAMVVAQAIYGDNFNISIKGGLVEAITKQQEAQQKFYVALYVMDKDFEVAKKAGLGFEDTLELKKNEKYLYRIYSPYKNGDRFFIDTVASLIGLNDTISEPKIKINALFSDKIVSIKWDLQIYKEYFIGYNIEKSTDGINFKRINKTPFSIIENEKEVLEALFNDSLENNEIEYFYRVNGINSFGEESEFSNIVSGKGLYLLTFTPVLRKKENVENTAILYWDFPKEGEKFITKFQVFISKDALKDYKILKDDIGVDMRNYVYNVTYPSYFMVSAIGKYGERTNSMPIFVNYIDSLPPEKPTGLNGIIDSNGIINLKWDKNIDSDLKGYMVYKSLLKEGPFVQKNSEPENITSFIDSVSMKMTNKYIYYKIKAFDNRFNPSEFSELLILKKPDIIPPLAPKITNYIATQNTILLKWVNSEIDEDIERTKIYRLKKGDENWILLAELKDINITQYEDSDLDENQYYDYKIISVDDSNLESKDSKIVKIKTKKILIQKPITGFRFYKLIHQKGIKLEWKYDKEVMYYDIYKKIGNQPTNKIYSTNKKEYIDSTYKDGLDYEYSIRAFLKDGSISEINKLIVK